MSFFNRNKHDDRHKLDDSTVTPGIKEKIGAMVSGWSEAARGLRDATPDTCNPALSITRKADVDYLLKAMQDEVERIEAETDRIIADRNRQYQSEIVQRESQIDAINGEVESAKAKIQAQDAEINTRAERRAKLLVTVGKIEPSLDASSIMKDADIRREVVRRQFGEQAVSGQSDSYVDARFDSLEARINVDPFARVMKDCKPAMSGAAAAEKAYQDSVEDLRNAHKTRH